MKLDAVVASLAAAGIIAADKAPDAIRAVLAADKKGKDAAGSGLGARELEENDKPGAQDRATDEREQAEDEYAEAMDSKAAAHDAEEEEADKGKEDKAAKDRKAARDSRKAGRDSRKGARDSRKGARDKRAHDRNDDPEHTNDSDVTAGDPSTPGGNRAGGSTAIDSATVDARVKAAVDAERDRNTALREVEPILGTVTFDNAGDAYKAALDKLGVSVEGVHPSAYRSMLTMAKDRAKVTSAPPLAADAATVSGLEKVIPGYGRLR